MILSKVITHVAMTSSKNELDESLDKVLNIMIINTFKDTNSQTK